MKKNTSLLLVAFLLSAFAFGCSNSNRRANYPDYRHERQPRQPSHMERTVSVEPHSPSDYAARACHGAIEAGQTTYEAGADTYDWLKRKKNQAKQWVHEHTADE